MLILEAPNHMQHLRSYVLHKIKKAVGRTGNFRGTLLPEYGLQSSFLARPGPSESSYDEVLSNAILSEFSSLCFVCIEHGEL